MQNQLDRLNGDRLPGAGDALTEPTLRQEPSLDADLGPDAVASYAGLDRGPEPHEHAVDADDALRMPAPLPMLERRPGDFKGR
mgnify:CR=1 FL=1